MKIIELEEPKNESEASELVKISEERFKSQLEESANKIIKEEVRIALLAGPSCSGKTTGCSIIADIFKKYGKKVKVISIDDYYFNRSVLIERAKKNNTEIDFDSPDTIDFDFLSKTVSDIYEGKKTGIPIFDFRPGKRISVSDIDSSEYDLFIFEGIQALYKEFIGILGNMPYYSMFISPESALSVSGRIFEGNDLRLARRIVRDDLFRQSNAEMTLRLWNGVRQNEEKYIFPNKDNAIVKIDSTMLYEPFVIKPYLEGVVSNVRGRSGFKSIADSIAEKYRDIAEISGNLIPEESVFREFIGYGKSQK